MDVMQAVRDRYGRVIGAKAGDVLYNTRGDVCAFVQGTDVVAFQRGRIGQWDQGIFRDRQGNWVGNVTPVAPCPPQRPLRRKRYRVTPWLRFSLPAPRPLLTFCPWAIWKCVSTSSGPE